jgi:hypothetical protein
MKQRTGSSKKRELKIKLKVDKSIPCSSKSERKNKTHLFTPTAEALDNGPTKLDGKRRLRSSLWSSERLALTVAAILDGLRLRRICGCAGGHLWSGKSERTRQMEKSSSVKKCPR